MTFPNKQLLTVRKTKPKETFEITIFPLACFKSKSQQTVINNKMNIQQWSKYIQTQNQISNRAYSGPYQAQ
jgi:hypothetical protein